MAGPGGEGRTIAPGIWLPVLLESATATHGADNGESVLRHRLLIGAIFVLSGAAGLTYEVVWSRQLVLVFGNTTQAVAAILTGYFLGMAVGNVLGGRLADRVRSSLRLYGLLELALVAIVLITPSLFGGIREVYRSAYASLETAPGAPGRSSLPSGRCRHRARDRPHGRNTPGPEPTPGARRR